MKKQIDEIKKQNDEMKKQNYETKKQNDETKKQNDEINKKLDKIIAAQKKWGIWDWRPSPDFVTMSRGLGDKVSSSNHNMHKSWNFCIID